MRPPGHTSQWRHGAVAVALVVTMLSLLGPALAQPTAVDQKRALAIEITEVAVSAVDLQQLSAAVLDQLAKNSPNTSEEFRRILVSLAPIVVGEMNDMMSDVVKLAARFYEDKFDLDELKQIRDFSISAVGRKQSRLGAEFTGRFAVTMQQTMAQRVPALEAKIRDELIKRGYKL